MYVLIFLIKFLFLWAEFQKKKMFLKAFGFIWLNGLKIMVEILVEKNCFNVTWFYVINRYIKKWGE